MAAHFHIFTGAIAASVYDEDWYHYYTFDGVTGYRDKWVKITNVNCVTWTEEGALRPGYYFPFTPTANSGATIGVTSGTTNYVRLNTITDYIEWTIPVGMPTSDTLEITGLTTTLRGAIDVIRYRGGSPTTIISNLDFNAATNNRAVFTTTGLDIQAGDTIRMQWIAGETANVWIAQVRMWASAGTWSSGQHMVIPSPVQITIAASSRECAYNIAPTGSALKPIGGIAHNLNTANCQENSPVNTWTKDGSGWTLAAGYTLADTLSYNRSSTVRYDGTTTNLATIEYTWTLAIDSVTCAHSLTLNATADTGYMYRSMGPAFCTSMFDDDGTEYLRAGMATPTVLPNDNRYTWFETPQSKSFVYENVAGNGTIDTGRMFLEPRSENSNQSAKSYWNHTPTNQSGVASGTVFSGTTKWYPAGVNGPAAGSALPVFRNHYLQQGIC